MKLSSAAKALFDIAIRSDANVLITGPTGSGKSLLARDIHLKSRRKNGNFITVNLASLHEGTLESELFGHEKGAFTGADQRKTGRLELAQGGTVFLDEIGDLSLRLQARLLEFLQCKTITPVGSNREIKLNLRIITATHKDLEMAVKRGEFREDLFHRLRVIPFQLSALCDRLEDFDSLVHILLEEICASESRSILRLSEGFARKLEGYHWPGNVRELRNVLEYAVISCRTHELRESDLPPWFRQEKSSPSHHHFGSAAAEISSSSYREAVSEFEKEFIHRALKLNRGRINQTARAIGLNKTTLLRRMKAYELSAAVQ